MQISMDVCNVNWKFYHNLFQECKGEELPDLLNILSNFFQYILNVVCMLSMEDLERDQKNLDEILAILCVLCGKFFMILQPEGKILFKLQAKIYFPFSLVTVDG